MCIRDRISSSLQHREVRIEGPYNVFDGLDQLQRIAVGANHQDHPRDGMLGQRHINEIHRLFHSRLILNGLRDADDLNQRACRAIEVNVFA